MTSERPPAYSSRLTRHHTHHTRHCTRRVDCTTSRCFCYIENCGNHVTKVANILVASYSPLYSSRHIVQLPGICNSESCANKVTKPPAYSSRLTRYHTRRRGPDRHPPHRHRTRRFLHAITRRRRPDRHPTQHLTCSVVHAISLVASCSPLCS